GNVANIPLQGEFVNRSPFDLRHQDGNSWALFENDEETCVLKRIPKPAFLNELTSDGIPMRKIALLHGKDCLASTVVQKCIYWEAGLQCKYCGIELSYHLKQTEVIKSPRALAEVLRAGIDEGIVTHVTLTSGSLSTRDKEVDLYCSILKEMKAEASVPIHVQIEPLNFEQLDRLRSAGADTIGIHVENFDVNVLKSICPGKFSKNTIQDYYKSWKLALDVFGDAQVSTFVLLGLGEREEVFRTELQKTVEMGVIPFLLPVRPIFGASMESFYRANLDFNIKMFRILADLLREHHVEPSKNKAGCVRCGACSAIHESLRDF
ncbi:MAG: radical SAM protein, partial [Candidatus Helarchaeales archaeon]